MLPSINLNIKENNPDYAPVLKMVTDVTGYNYCHIPFFKRFYFVDRVERKGQIILVGLSCDVLETYKDDILASNARFKRNLKTGDYMSVNIDKSELKTVQKIVGSYTMGTDRSLILTTIGI